MLLGNCAECGHADDEQRATGSCVYCQCQRFVQRVSREERSLRLGLTPEIRAELLEIVRETLVASTTNRYERVDAALVAFDKWTCGFGGDAYQESQAIAKELRAAIHAERGSR